VAAAAAVQRWYAGRRRRRSDRRKGIHVDLCQHVLVHGRNGPNPLLFRGHLQAERFLGRTADKFRQGAGTVLPRDATRRTMLSHGFFHGGKKAPIALSLFLALLLFPGPNLGGLSTQYRERQGLV
jgi:hypothetical protein